MLFKCSQSTSLLSDKSLPSSSVSVLCYQVKESDDGAVLICVSTAPSSLSFTCQKHQCCHEIRQSKLTSGHHQLKETEKSSRRYLDLATSSSCCSCRAGITLSISETMTQSLPYSHVKYEERKTTKVMSSNSIHHV